MLENDATGMHIHIDEAFLMVWEFQAWHILQLAHCQCLECPRFFILQTTSARIKRRKNEAAVFLSELWITSQLKQAKKTKTKQEQNKTKKTKKGGKKKHMALKTPAP